MKEVIVVIPVYKNFLSKLEYISLNQACNVLNRYTICIIAPKKLEHHLKFKVDKIKYFSDENFISVRTYSKLLLSPEFYERFSEYKYMLIYQLDAFVFYDKLDYFCSLGYDYIGAPMPYFKWRNLASIGNGGLSLRKISSCVYVTKNLKNICKNEEMKISFLKAEDKFFGYCGKEKNINFSVPSINLSNMFAMEYNIHHCYEKLSENNLPFGCHGWSKKYYFNIWKPFIEKFTNSLNEIEFLDLNSKDIYKNYVLHLIRPYLLSRITKNELLFCLPIVEIYFPIKEKYILWGNGTIGKEAFNFMNVIKRHVSAVFDREFQNQEEKFFMQPDINWAITRECKIIITTDKFSNEISKLLENEGLKKDKHFFIYTDLVENLIKKYYEKIWYNMKYIASSSDN